MGSQTGRIGGNLHGRYKQIVPPMDRAYSALVEDLADRGLLDATLVINTGEFGRTPVVNNKAGRDHWPNVYWSDWGSDWGHPHSGLGPWARKALKAGEGLSLTR